MNTATTASDLTAASTVYQIVNTGPGAITITTPDGTELTIPAGGTWGCGVGYPLAGCTLQVDSADFTAIVT